MTNRLAVGLPRIILPFAIVHIWRVNRLPEKSGCRIAAVRCFVRHSEPKSSRPEPSRSEQSRTEQGQSQQWRHIYSTIVPMCPGANLRALISFAGPSFNYMAEGSVYRHARIGAISARNHRAHWIWILSGAVHSSDLSVMSAPHEIPKDTLVSTLALFLSLSLSLSLSSLIRNDLEYVLIS